MDKEAFILELFTETLRKRPNAVHDAFLQWTLTNPPPADYDFENEQDPLDNTAFEQYEDEMAEWNHKFIYYFVKEFIDIKDVKLIE